MDTNKSLNFGKKFKYLYLESVCFIVSLSVLLSLPFFKFFVLKTNPGVKCIANVSFIFFMICLPASKTACFIFLNAWPVNE